MESKKTKSSNRQKSEYLTLQDLMHLCLGNWPWFVLSLLITLSIAEWKILRTVPVYQRSASLLIKEKGKANRSMAVDAGNTIDTGIFSFSTNLSNEITSMLSPDVMLEVVKRLNLDMDYQTDGAFHRNTLYGSTLPIKVTFVNQSEYNDCSFDIKFKDDRSMVLSNFIQYGEPAGDGQSLVTTRDKTIKSPIGTLTIEGSPFFDDRARPNLIIHVKRVPPMSAMSACRGRLSAGLHDDGSSIIDLRYQDVNTERAEDILNAVINVYNENWVRDRNQIAVSTSEFINERLNVIEHELGHVDSDISSFKSRNLIPDVDATTRMHMQNANSANLELNGLNNQMALARFIRNHVAGLTNKTQLLPVNVGIDNANIEGQINEYNALVLQRNNLIANSSEENPLVIDLDSKMASIRNSIINSIDNQINVLNTKISSAQNLQATSTSHMATNPGQAKYLLSVERQQKVKESLYLFLLQKREENELSQAFTAYNTRVVTSPSGSNVPISPLKRNMRMMAIGLGLLIPLVVLLIRENMNTKVRGRTDIDKLTIPFIGEIPQYGKLKRHNKLLNWIQGINKKKKKNDEEETRDILVKPKSRNVINEAFRVVRTNMDFIAGADHANKVIMFTSINPGSGKTFLTINIATSFAIKGNRTIAIDLDLRRGSLSKYIGKPEAGMADFLSGRVDSWRDIAVPVEGYENIEVIPVGTIPPNPAELLLSPRLEQLLSELREQYDTIFLDCPPIDIVADTSVIAKWADMTVFVIRAGLMDRDMLPVVEGYYNEKKFNNMSVILNGTDSGSSRYSYHRYGYHYGYGYGYGYGGYAKEDDK